MFLFFDSIKILVQLLYFSIKSTMNFLLSLKYKITEGEWDPQVIRVAFKGAVQSRPSSYKKDEMEMGAPGVWWLHFCWLILPRSQFDNSAILQRTEPSINVTLMNLIPAVLFNSCPASQWTDLVWVICAKYLGNRTNLLFHLAKSLFRKHNHSE